MQFIVGNSITAEEDFFSLTQDSWNDFGYYTLFHVAYKENPIATPFTIGLVKIASEEMSRASFGRHSSSTTLPDEFERLPSSYYSLGQSDEYYENLITLEKRLGKPLRGAFLASLRDVAYSPTILDKVKDLHPFITSLTRSIPLATVKNQYYRIAHGGARLTDYHFSYIPSFASNRDTEKIDFSVTAESTPSSNVYAIIGRNGAGKTSFLKDFAADALEIDSDSLIENSLEAPGSPHAPKQEQTPLFSNVIFIGFSAFDSFPITAKEFNRENIREEDYYFIGIQSLYKACGEYSATQAVAPHEAISSLFKSSLMSIVFSPSKLELWKRATEPLAYDPTSPIVLIRDSINHGDTPTACEDFSHMSSGHKIALLTISALVDHVVEKSLAIIDEPETHLHPPLLSALISSLSIVLTHSNGIALIATHSPVVLQEIPSACAWRLERIGGRSLLKPLDLETYGTDINTLMRDIFGFEIDKTGFHKTIRQVVAESMGDRERAKSKITSGLGSEGRLLLHALTTETAGAIS